MHFYALVWLDLWPFLFELGHHLSPDKHFLLIFLFNFLLGLALKQEHPECLLDFCCFRNQETQVSIRYSGLVHSPVFLNASCCELRSFESLESEVGCLTVRCDFILVLDTVEEFISARLRIQVNLLRVTQCCNLPTINICHLYIVSL